MTKTQLIKLLLLVLVGACIALFFVFDGSSYLNLSVIKAQQREYIGLFQQQPVLFVTAFALLYIAITALSLPIATLATLLAGAIFGLGYGLLLVSFASAIGATLAFLMARFIFKQPLQKKYAKQLASINAGFEKEGALYLFALRLVPLFPFFVVNLLMGLLPIKTRTYYIVSQIGMLPGTAVYVFAGTELGKISQLSDIASPQLWLAMTLLGLLPLLMKKLLPIIKGAITMAKYDFNTVVIGGGAAGLVSALVGSAVNAKVALIEKHQMGGDCLNTGCVPSKALIKAGRVAHDIKHASKFGIHCQAPEVNFQEVMQGVHQAIKTIEPHDSVQRFSELGVVCFSGDAVIETPHRVKVNGQLLTTRSIIIASGAEPIIPDIPGLDSCDYMTSETLWELQALPKKLLVLGGGPIGCEMTQAFSRLGSQVTVVDRNTRLMKREDDDVSEHIHQVFNSEGIDVRLQAQIESISGNTAYIRQGEGITEIAFDGILLALGRKARVSGFGLEALGVELDQGNTIAANEFLQTNIPNIFVCGDAVAPFQFTHTAAHQAWYACVNALFTPFKTFKVDYSVIPWATFTDPEVARVGLNEREAKAQNIAHEVTIYPLSELDRAITEQSNTGFIKVLTAGRSDKILGVSFVGEHAGDLIAEFVFAMKHNLGLSKVLATIHIYPTWAEANKFAAGEWRKKHVPAFALKALSIFHRWRRS